MGISEKVTGKNIALVALVGVGGFVAYKLIAKGKEGVPYDPKITEYENVRTGEKGSPSKVVNFSSSDLIKVSFEFKYFGPSIDGRYHLAAWQSKPAILGGHDDVASPPDWAFNVTKSTLPQTVKGQTTFSLSGVSTGKYGLYFKIMGIGGDDIVSPYYTGVISVTGVGDEPTGGITLLRPTALPTGGITPGVTVTLNFSISSAYATTQNYSGRIEIKKGGLLDPGIIETKTIPAGKINPGATATFSTTHVATKESNPGRNVKVVINVGGQTFDEVFPDVFSVSSEDGPPPVNFTVQNVAAVPDPVVIGQNVTITVQVQVDADVSQTAEVIMRVHEGAAIGSGKLLDTKSSGNLVFSRVFKTVTFTTVASGDPGQEDRDVKIEIRMNGQVVKGEQVFPTAFKVISGVALRKLTVIIAPTTSYGQVSTSQTGQVEGSYIKYPDRTLLTLRAQPYVGYEFYRWTGDASSTNPSVDVLMDRDRVITAEFRQTVTTIINIKVLEYDAVAFPGGSIRIKYSFSYKGVSQSLPFVIGMYRPGWNTPDREWTTTLPTGGQYNTLTELIGEYIAIIPTDMVPDTYGLKLYIGDQESVMYTNVITIRKETVSFNVRPWGTSELGIDRLWALYYRDPVTRAATGDGYFHPVTDPIPIRNVKPGDPQYPGGYLEAYFSDGNVASRAYYSVSFHPIDGGDYTFYFNSGDVV